MSRPLHSAPLVMNHVTQLCKCGKTYCISEQDAKRVVRRIEKRKGCSNPVRFYQCRHSGWHWTSQVHQQERAS